MVPIEDLTTLRAELSELIEQGYAQATDALERRGVEVDHCFYKASENRTMDAAPVAVSSAPARPTQAVAASSPATVAPPQSAPANDAALAELRSENQQLKSDVEDLKQNVARLNNRLDELCRDLGV